VRTLCIANQKGGVGKSTVAVNLAACLAEREQRVLLIDLDPQAATTSWIIGDGEVVGYGLVHVFTGNGNLEELVVRTRVARVDLVPAAFELQYVESALHDEPSSQTILNCAVKQLPQRWDVLLIDTPPGLGLLTSSALVACQEVIIPCEASALALAGVSMLTAHVQKIRQQLNPKLVVSGVLPSRVDRRKRLHVQSVLRLREMYGDRVFTTVIRENVRVQESPSFGQPVIVYSPDSAGSADFRALAAEVMARGNQMPQCPES